MVAQTERLDFDEMKESGYVRQMYEGNHQKGPAEIGNENVMETSVSPESDPKQLPLESLDISAINPIEQLPDMSH